MDKSRVEPSIFFIEKIIFSLKLFSGHFYGQSFIKTVRGPFAKFHDKTLMCMISKQNVEVLAACQKWVSHARLVLF